MLSERKGKGIWQGLYQFPLIETNKNISINELISKDEFVNLFPFNSSISLFNKKEIVHKLSHQHISTKFWIIETENSQEIKIKWAEIEKYPVPILIANFLEAFSTKK
jgi:A/G-specific adenine glycosylase